MGQEALAWVWNFSPAPGEGGTAVVHNLQLLVLAVAPALFLLLYLYYKDRHEREPVALVSRTFFAGALMAVPVLVTHWLVVAPAAAALGIAGGRGYLWWQAFVAAGLLEEVFKFLAVIWVAYRNPNFNEPYDGIIYAAAASLGFATIENVIYVLQGDVSLGVARAVMAVPAHAMFGIAMGYYLGRVKFARRPVERLRLWLAALAVPVLLHGFYDVLALDPTDQLAFILLYPLVAFLWVRGLRQVEELSAHSPFSPTGGRRVTLRGRCDRCETPLVEGARFCFHCGAAVAPAEQTVQDLVPEVPSQAAPAGPRAEGRGSRPIER